MVAAARFMRSTKNKGNPAAQIQGTRLDKPDILENITLTYHRSPPALFARARRGCFG
jgi:hypothetical protein